MERKVRPALVRRPERRPTRRDDLRQEIAGVLLAALGVWLYLSLAGSGGGRVGEKLAEWLGVLVGGGRWVLPGLVVALGVYMVYMRRGFAFTGRMGGLALLFLALVTGLHFPHYQQGDLPQALAGRGGGLVGAALAQVITKVFGPQGRWVTLSAALVVGVMLATQAELRPILEFFRLMAARAFRGASAAAGSAARSAAARVRQWPARELTAPPRVATGPTMTVAPAPLFRPDRGDSGLPHAEDEGAVRPRIVTAAVAQPAPGLEPTPGRAPALKVVKGGKGAAAEPAPPTEGVALALGTRGSPGQLAIYQIPPLSLLRRPQSPGPMDTHQHILDQADLLEHTLETFGVKAKVVEIHPGPAITRYELQPAPGVKVSKITSLADDLALNLAAADIRIEAPIPGKAAIGIEVPNKEIATVFLRDVLESAEFQGQASRLAVGLGKDLAGRPVVASLDKMPHLLIAGATGSGKSVCMNAVICSLLFRAQPDQVKFLMIDPKMVELSAYNGVPHLTAPVVTDPKKAAGYLKWAVKEMETRYELFATAGVRDIARYNQLCSEDPLDGGQREEPRLPLPLIVVFIDELADLMMVAPVDVEDAICRLAQMARAAGIHLVVATQRPSVDVVTGLIKANIPSRISFAVSSQVDSRTILDMGGAEKLLGKGDMLFHPVGLSKPVRAQGAFISEKEVEALVNFVKHQGRPEYRAESLELEGPLGGARAGQEKEEGADPIFAQAVRIIVEEGRASVSILQRRLRINYTKAARFIDDMEQRGFIGAHQGPKPREVLITMDQWHQEFGGQVD